MKTKSNPETTGQSMKRKLEVGYYLATYALAVVAVVGLWFSIRSSRETARTLDFVQKEVSALTMPLIEVTGYDWISSNNAPLSRENLPTGIIITYRNVSNVPVQIDDTSLEVYYGEKKFDDIVHTVGGEGRKILRPGEPLQSGTIQGSLFPRFLRDRKNILESPNLRIVFCARFCRLYDTKTYEYKTEREIGFAPDQPSLKNTLTISEEVNPMQAKR